jgi:hypothetical protein
MTVKRLESNIISLCQVTRLTISNPVVGLLPLASGQAFKFGQLNSVTKIGFEPQR